MSPFSKRSLLALAVAASMLPGVAHATTILNFKQIPTVSGIPEFQFNTAPGDTAPSFRTDVGAIGNGDGNLPTSSQTSGGLQVTWASGFGLTAGEGAGIGQSTDPLKANVFYDVSLELTGLLADGGATVSGGVIQQNLAGGSFAIYSTTAAVGNAAGTTAGQRQLLLSGTITDAYITGLTGSGTGSTISANITYTGGWLPLIQAIGAGSKGGFTFSDLQINPILSVGGGNPAYLANFKANGTGQFSVSGDTGQGSPVPLPAAAWGGMSLMGLLGGMRAIRRRSISR